ncbi:glycosyltransferase family 2 protein [Verrucosispora sp. WMMD1129]|uniref:glycosyltransferase family 2 protein n=1 Tax=Verrucosispora sp. WMMD1129 TaxID=3016093 RepID=UPI00249CB5B3|nr:glycosyltransferase family 2 protein [Verrucosispora sp. WMMD1129]WFE45311.1 glycosyltransferase family 2 protein [Verrucosispora sp. WMMD1129]
MTDGPSWSILIPTIGQRADLFARLLDVLLPQLDAHAGRVRVLAWWNNGTPRLTDIRQTLMRDAGTDYVSFVDDDDLVEPDFVDAIVAALASRPDHVGFQVAYHVDGDLREVCDHSLRHRRWYRDRAKGLLLRDVTHLDPIRRDVALRGDFRKTRKGWAEDRVWVAQVRRHLRTEEYIPRVLYHYLYSPAGSAWQHPERLQQGGSRPTVEHPFFAWHPESS